MESSLEERLVQLLGTAAVLPVDGWEVDGLTPQAVVRPEDRGQVAEVLHWASKESVSVIPRGGGTRTGLGNVPRQAELVLDLGGLERLLDYQPADMTATVEAGVTLASLQQQLASGGEFVPLESGLPDRSTIGGILSVGMSGPLAFAYGLPREWLIGIGVLSPQGTATKAGGKVVKNVTGYDLNKLYTGSLGTLGVIIEASFKLLPVDHGAGALLASFPSLPTSISSGSGLLQSPVAPMGYHSMTSGLSTRFHESLDLISDEIGTADSNNSLSLAFYSGRAQATAQRLEEAEALLLSAGASGVQRFESDATYGLLRWITNAPSEIGRTSAMVIKLSIPAKSTISASAQCGEITLAVAHPEQLVDPGFGTIRLIWPQTTESADTQAFLETIQQTRAIANQCGGSAVVEYCPLTVKSQIDVWGDTPDSIEIMRRIKDKFDPAGLLNPGRFLGGI